jgi:hypothetical protein
MNATSQLRRYGIWKRTPRFVFSVIARFNGQWAEIETFMRDHQLGLHETLETVERERLSLARFGDGELALALRSDAAIAFQKGSPELQSELRAILLGEGHAGVSILVCIPGITVRFYRQYWAKYWPLIRPLLSASRTYGNTSVSREGLFRLDPEAGRRAWRAIWDGKHVCFVVGKGSRFEPIPDLFDGVASQRTVYSLPRGAYADVPRLIDEIVSDVSRETLLLLALGPAATVLAARLAALGYWALDIGHIANAYQTIAHGAPRAETMPLVTEDRSPNRSL